MPRRLHFLATAFLPALFLVAPYVSAQSSEAPAQDAAKDTAVSASTAVSDTPQEGVATHAFKGPVYVKKGKKEEYVGPKDLVVLTPTPMLDEEGKQRLDPDGKPMFNPPVKQQRDKHGNPAFTPDGKPLLQTATVLGYDENGKKLHVEKIKKPKTTPVAISRGTFTVDGIVGKAELNYRIADLRFIYLYVPGIGVTIVSNHAFAGAKEQQKAFDGSTLTVRADEHILQLASDKQLLGKVPSSAFVAVNRDFKLPSRYPVVGYGETMLTPYAWPGSHANEQLAGVDAPPIPENLKPTMLMQPCAKGQMRMPAPPVLPGQVAPPQPCVSIAQAEAARKAQSTSSATASNGTVTP